MSAAAVLVQATDAERGCTTCGSQKTVTLHPHHGRRCPDHATLPPGPYDRGLALDMVELGRADAAFAYLRIRLARDIDVRFAAARVQLALTVETEQPVVLGPSPEDRQAARDLWAELGRQEMAQATPEQLLGFMRRCSDTVGLDLAAKILDSQQRAADCWMRDHEGRLDYAESHLRALS